MTNFSEKLNLEELLYKDTYNFIRGFINGRKLKHLPKALSLAKQVHNGQYRKGTVMVNGEECRLPYFVHVLKVTSFLISLDLPMSNEELDILHF